MSRGLREFAWFGATLLFAVACGACPKHEAASEERGATTASGPVQKKQSGDAGSDAPSADTGSRLHAWVDAMVAERWEDAKAQISALPEAERASPEVRLALAHVERMLGHDAETIRLLTSLGDALPLLGEVIAKERALAAMKVGPHEAAAQWLSSQTAPSSWLLAAEAWLRAGDTRRARSETERVLAAGKRARDLEERARTLRFRLASEAKDEPGVDLDARWLATFATDDEVAKKAATVLARAKPPKPLTAEELATRARTLAAAGRDEAALRVVELAANAKGGLSKVERCRARAEVLYKARTRYADAAVAYRTCAAMKSPRSGEDAFLAARALSRADRDADALAAFASVARRYPKTTWADQAEFHIARTHALAGAWTEAAFAFDTYAKHWPDGREATEARRYRALAHLMAGNHKTARKLLEELAGDAKQPEMQARWTNLAALAALRDGEKLHALSRWADVARSHPATWAALVARAHLSALSATIPPVFEASTTSEPSPPPMDVTLPPPIDTLHAIGLDDDAERALREREGAIVAHAGSREVEALCDAYGMVDRGKRRYQIARRIPTALVATAPTNKNLFAWNCLFPRPHERHVRAAAEANGISPSLVWAVMRQESAFDPEVVSPARAVGLMQLMPKTAREVAKALGVPHEQAWLTLPGHNITLGARYLKEVLDRFDGKTALAVAAYNAGPDAISRWKAKAKGQSLDVFVEMIPFVETREYVVRVMGNRARYELLAKGTEGLSPVTLPID